MVLEPVHELSRLDTDVERLIERGNKRTEEQLEREAREREAHKQATHAAVGPGALKLS